MILIVFLVIDIARDHFSFDIFLWGEPKIYSDDKMIVRCFYANFEFNSTTKTEKPALTTALKCLFYLMHSVL